MLEAVRHSKRIFKSSLWVYVAVVAFGASTWIDLNGVYVDLPILVHLLPEGWSLASILVVICQTAFVGPVAYVLVDKFARSWLTRNLNVIIILMLSFNVACTAILAGIWNQEAVVVGSSHSVGLMVIFFFLSLVDSTSNLAYLPWLSRLKPSYTVAFFVGCGLSGLIPSMLSLIQGGGDIKCILIPATAEASNSSNSSHFKPVPIPPRFGPSMMFFFLFIILCFSLLCFVYLVYSEAAKRERLFYQTSRETASHRVGAGPSTSQITPGALSNNNNVTEENYGNSMSPQINVFCNAVNNDFRSDSVNTLSEDVDHKARTLNLLHLNQKSTADLLPGTGRSGPQLLSIHRCGLPVMLMLTFWVCALMNGVLPSLQPYSCLPYGPVVYHFAASLSSAANPVGGFIPFFVSVKRIWIFVGLTFLMTLGAVYCVAMAALSPTPFLVGTVGGSILIVSSWVLVIGACAYLRSGIAETLQRTSAKGSGARVMFWCGVATQAGSFAGSVIIFPMVNVFKFFKIANPCSG